VKKVLLDTTDGPSEMHVIIRNLEKLKRDRANSGERKSGKELRQLTDKVIRENLAKISQIQGTLPN
jgi:hypothetical protein